MYKFLYEIPNELRVKIKWIVWNMAAGKLGIFTSRLEDLNNILENLIW